MNKTRRIKSVSKKKILLVLMTAVLSGAIAAGCGANETEKKESKGKTEEQSQKSGIQMPECEEMDEALLGEFKEANTISSLCEKYGTIQIDSSYVFMDENGKKSNGGKSTDQYRIGENGIEYQSISDDYCSYQNGETISYSKFEMPDETGTGQGSSYMVAYNTTAFNENWGMDIFSGIYTGAEYATQYGYKETADGYEIYEAYDYGDGTGNVITYYANKDKVVEKMESLTYPEKAARYVDSTRELKTGVDVSIAPIEEFENGEITVTVIEKASGAQTQIKMPAGTEIYFCVNDNEIVTKDEAGIQMIGESRYDTYMIVNEDATLYIVESAPSQEEESMLSDIEPVG